MTHRVPVLGLLLTLTLALTALEIPQADAQTEVQNDVQTGVQGEVQPPVQTYADIHDFTTGTLTSPGNPGILAQGRDGNLYGTAPTGGTLGFGGVFRITPAGVYKVIYNFDGTMHGKGPKGGLTLGTDGNFYGTTYQGGSSNDGTLFKITSGGVLTVLHHFVYTDGTNPYAPPIQGTDGNWYGATSVGGTGAGSVYKMTPAGVLTPIHIMAFPTGSLAEAPLLQGTDGSFYGTTLSGGQGDGEIFKITPAGVFTVLYSFDFTHGSGPTSGLVQGSDGSFYGTTSGGGTLDGGVVFKITPAKVLSVLYNFNAKPASVDGKYPDAGLTLANDGFFYGVTSEGGANGFGTVYKISPAGVYSSLYSFVQASGSTPQTTLRQHTSGKFYGLANAGGANSLGTIFSFDVGLKPFIATLPTSGKVAKAVGILGGGLTGTTNVNFNGTNATFTASSDTYITTSVPNGATTGFVNATTPGGALKSIQKFRVTPSIAGISPSSGVVGSTVTITGVSLTGATKVTFSVGKAAVFTVNSDTKITATVPVGAVTGKISVNTPGGTASSPTVFTVN